MKRQIPESELLINDDGSVFHLHIKPGMLADNVLLVGDPGRVEMVSSFFTDIESRTASREFVSATGTYKGTRFTVLSTGIGTDNIDIVVNELDALVNIDFKTRTVKDEHKSLNILRIGTSGAIQPDIPIGSMVFSEYSIGFDGLLNWYAGRDSVVDLDMEKRFVAATGWLQNLPHPYFIAADKGLADRFRPYAVMGMTMSAPGFYGPQGRVLRIPLAMPDMISEFERFRYGERKITNFEMEGSAIAGLSAILGHHAGTVCCIIANRHLKSGEVDYKDLVRKVVLKSLDILAE